VQRRCDHDPAAPRLRLAIVVAANLPRLLQDAIKWAVKLYARPQLFPEISGRAFAAADVGRIRKRRTERLEALVLVLIALLRRCDLRTLRVGDQRADGLCSGVPIAKLCEATGLEPSRVVRALADLEAAGYIRSVQPVEALQDHHADCTRAGRCACPPLLGADGKQRHRGFPSVRVVTELTFARLGIKAAKLKAARAHGYRRWCRMTGRPASAAQIIGNRRQLRRLVRGNRTREKRLEAGGGTAAAFSSVRPPPRAPDPRRLDAANAARLGRLQAISGPPGPAPEPPPDERSAR
jgi:DNA-binding transcriptional ArsR family regulator